MKEQIAKNEIHGNFNYKIKSRNFYPRPALPTELPFVTDVKIGPRKKKRSFWNVQPISEYDEANLIGLQYACDFVQYLKQNRGCSLLTIIVSDMDNLKDNSATKGYAVGFLSFLEDLLYVASTKVDYYAMAQERVERYLAWKTEREQECDDD